MYTGSLLIERSVLVFVFVFVFLCVFVIVLVTSRWTLVLSSFRRCMICEWQCSNSRNVALYWWSAYRVKKKRKSHSKVGTRWVRQWTFWNFFWNFFGTLLEFFGWTYCLKWGDSFLWPPPFFTFFWFLSDPSGADLTLGLVFPTLFFFSCPH